MGCNSCKKKSEERNKLLKSSEFISNTTIMVIIIWSIFACYGIYSLIKDLL